MSTSICGRRLAYWRSDTDAPTPGADRLPGSTVLLLHGLAADHAGLLPLARHWPDVVAPDLPGFGRSEPLRRTHSMSHYAAAVEGLCERLALSDVTVIGHSLGATIALTLAALYPRRVRALVLLSPVTTGSGPSTWLTRAYYGLGSLLPHAAARLWFFSRAAVYLSDRSTLTSSDPRVRDRIINEDYRTAAMADPRAIAEIYRSIRHMPFNALAATVRAPTLLLGAEHDALASPATLASLHSRMRRSTMIIVPAARHLWPVEEPSVAADIIAASLRALVTDPDMP